MAKEPLLPNVPGTPRRTWEIGLPFERTWMWASWSNATGRQDGEPLVTVAPVRHC